jgi:hypothetical protein
MRSLLFFLLLFTFEAFGQKTTIQASIIKAREEFWMKNNLVTDVSTDTAFIGAVDTKIPSQLAVKKYADRRIGGDPFLNGTKANGWRIGWNGTAWVPVANTATLADGDRGDVTVSGTGSVFTVDGLQGRAVLSTAPTSNQVLKWNGSAWAPAADDNTGTTYTQGAGIGIVGTVISNTGDTNAGDDITTATAAAGDLSGTYPAPTVARLQGRSVATTAPTSNQVLKWNGTAWAPAPDDNTGTTYTQGAGIGIVGTVISNTGDTNAGDDVTGAGTVNVIPKFTASRVVGGSLLTDDGNTLRYTGSGFRNRIECYDESSSSPTLAVRHGIWPQVSNVSHSQITLSNGTTFFGASDVSVQIKNEFIGDNLLAFSFYDGSFKSYFTARLNANTTTFGFNSNTHNRTIGPLSANTLSLFAGLTVGGLGSTSATNTIHAMNGLGVLNFRVKDDGVMYIRGTGGTAASITGRDGNGEITNVATGTGLSFVSGTLNNTGDTDANNDITTTSTAGGDVSGTFSNLQLINNSVGPLEIIDQAVITQKIADNAVTEIKLLDGAISTSKVANGAITLQKLASASVNSNIIVNGSIDAIDFAQQGATNGQPLVYSSTAPGFVPGTSGGDVTGPYTNLQLSANSVTSAEIADNAVGSSEITNGSIQATDLFFAAYSLGSTIYSDGTNWIYGQQRVFGYNDINSGGGVGSITLSGNRSDNYLRGSNWTDLTINMPLSPSDGQIATLSCDVSSSLVTWSGNGNTLVGSLPTTIAPGASFGFKFYSANSKWIRIN